MTAPDRGKQAVPGGGADYPIITLADYVEQRKWDSWIDDEEAQSLPVADVNRALGEYRAYLDVLHFLNGSYRPEYLEAVADRSERRKRVGPR